MKIKLILFLELFIFAVVFQSCDIYKAFKGNQEVVEFFNKQLNPWLTEEKKIYDKYNQLISGESFSSKVMWDELEKNLIPQSLKLRDEISKSQPKKDKLIKIQQMFLDKTDLLLEGFDLIREGLKKDQDKDSIALIYRGRDKLKEASLYNERIEADVAGLKKEFYIQDENKENKENMD